MTPSDPHFQIYHPSLVVGEDISPKYDALSIYTDSATEHTPGIVVELFKYRLPMWKVGWSLDYRSTQTNDVHNLYTLHLSLGFDINRMT